MLNTISTSVYIHTTESIRKLSLKKAIRKFVSNERGVTAVEYAIIAVAMSGVALVFIEKTDLKNQIGGMGDAIKANLQSAKTK